MVAEVLVEAAILEGVQLLALLDRAEIPVDSMFWVQLEESGYWRLVVGSFLVSEIGSSEAYTRLGKILRSEEFNLTLMDISFFGANSSDLLSLLNKVKSSGRGFAGESWVSYGEGVVYRWDGTFIEASLSCSPSGDEVKHALEAERKKSKSPKLLFQIEGSKVILRVHPQHGPQESLAGHELYIRLALRQLPARCETILLTVHESRNDMPR